MSEAKCCPFCGASVDTDDEDVFYPTGIFWREEQGIRHYVSNANRREGDQPVWVIGCLEHAGGCGAEMRGDTREETLARWNRRPPST